MKKQSSNVKLLILVGAVVLVGVLIYSSLQQERYRYEVCMNFHGNTHCAMASSATA